MFPLSLGFKLCVFLLWSLSMAAGGFYIEYIRWDREEAKYTIAVDKVITKIDQGNQRQLVRYRAKAAELDRLNINLEKDLEYARSQTSGTCSFGPSYISVWDAKLEGRPVPVPGAAGGVPGSAGETRAADQDDLLANEAINAAKWGRDREKLIGLREWACRVYGKGCD